jgi:hypothetical protein
MPEPINFEEWLNALNGVVPDNPNADTLNGWMQRWKCGRVVVRKNIAAAMEKGLMRKTKVRVRNGKAMMLVDGWEALPVPEAKAKKIKGKK